MAKKKTGRPTLFTPALGREILERLSHEPISRVFADPAMPNRQTFYNWLLNDPAFFDSSTRARAIAALRELDEAELEFDKEGVNVQLLRERLQHCRWKVSKLLPKTYGDRVAMEHSGTVGGVLIVPAPVTTEDWAAAAENQQREIAAKRAGQ